MIKDQIFSKAMDSVAALRVTSALNPVLWLCGIVTLPILCLSVFNPNLPAWMIVIAFIPLILMAFGFLFLLINDRDKLQSEDFQIRKQSLELIEQKGDLEPIQATTIEVIANPEFKPFNAEGAK